MKKKIILKHTGEFLLSIGIIILIIPYYFWAKTPGLSQMQLLINNWWIFLFGCLVSFLGVFIYSENV